MSLILSILRCPDAVPPETRQIQGGEFRIGRGLENDWVLADADRILSKRHCILAFRNGVWQIADLSTNGTYLNREEEPIGSAKPRPLHDGDRLRLGAYEVEVRIADQQRLNQDRPGPASHGSPFDDPFGETDFAPDNFASARQPDPFGDADPVSLAASYDPLTDDRRDEGFGAPATSDHSPAYDDAFRPPPVAPKLLPDDWDLDFAAKPPPKPERLAVPKAPIAPVAPASPSPPAAPPSISPPSNSPPSDSVSPPSAGGDLFAAFLKGAGMQSAQPEDAEAAMRQLGAAFRAVVTGLRQALIARATIKGEFRIEQTMIRARGNNPLKFSSDDDDALSALLGIGRRTDISADIAIADALRDMRLHEVAVMAAMQSAVRALLARLDPEAIRAEVEQSGRAMLPAQKKARAFDSFTTLHASITKALADDFDSLFGKSFARAYEQALREAESRES